MIKKITEPESLPAKINEIIDWCNQFSTTITEAEIKQKLQQHNVMESVLPTFDQILREEFLVNTQNYPKEYHKLFMDKFNRAKRRHDELHGKTAP